MPQTAVCGLFKSKLLPDDVCAQGLRSHRVCIPNRLDLKYPQTAVCGIRRVVSPEFVGWT
jgi:hypothetical protein